MFLKLIPVLFMVLPSFAQADDCQSRLMARSRWISQTQFIDLPQQQVLDLALVLAAMTEDSFAVVDIDDTLYPTEFRLHPLMHQWAHTNQDPRFEKIRSNFLSLRSHEVDYEPVIHLMRLGLENSVFEAAKKSIYGEISRSYFSDDHIIQHDRPYAGAPEYIRKLHKHVRRLVYLTGRIEETTRKGTLYRLRQDGVPVDDRVKLIMKPAPVKSTHEFKRTIFQLLRWMGHFAVHFDNEPENILSAQAEFPKAMQVFMDTKSRAQSAPAGQRIYRISGWR